MEFRILGALAVTDGQRSIELPRAKQRALLTMLVLHPNQVVSADRLVDAIWGDRPPPSANNTLQGYVSHLRRALVPLSQDPHGIPRIRTQLPGYVLDVDPERIDACRFERLIVEGRRAMARSAYQQAADAFVEALGLWRGPALDDPAYERFAAVEAARLNELRLTAAEEHVEAELALGRHGAVVGRIQSMVEDHPLREGLWGQLMMALYRCGRQADALRAYQVAKRTLGDEIGLLPGPALRRLEADILAQAPSLDWVEPKTPDMEGASSEEVSGVPFPRLLAVGQGNYVGRRELLSRLVATCRASAAGPCRMVLLTGEPGMGKTRTAAEVARAAYAEGATVLYGRCDEEFGVPYQPFVEALDWYTSHAGEPTLGRHPGELVRLQPLLAVRVAGLAAPVSSDPRSEEHLLFEATASWMVELARQRPLVLVLDDLHWATPAVLALLRHVARSALAEGEGVALLVMGAYRETEVDRDHPLMTLVADRALGLATVAISALSPIDVEELVAEVTSDVGGDIAGLAGRIHAETEGNPFFIEEVLRHLIETRAVRRVEERNAVGSSIASVPEGVRIVVSRRLDRLSRRSRAVLSEAAVLGRDFDAEALAALSDLSEEWLLDALDEAMRACLIEETGADHYRFAHVLVRTTLYEGQSGTRRRRAHRRAAEAIEKLRPDDVVALAHHFAEAGPIGDDFSRAAHYGLLAAEQALGARAPADAEVRFRHVVDVLSAGTQPATPSRLQALCGLGEAQRDQGDPTYRSTLLEAGRLAQETGNVAALVRATLSNSRGVPSVIGGVDEERVALIEIALELVGSHPGAERARLLALLAAEVTFTRDDQRRLALADEAEDMARGLHDDTLLAEVLNRTGYAAFSPRRVERLVTRGEEATRLSDATGDPTQRVLARFFWSGALLTAGDIATFRRATQEMLVVSAEAAPTLRWLALATQARLFMLDGADDDAQRASDDAFRLAQELGEPDGAAWWTATQAVHTWGQGRYATLVDALRAGIEVYPDEPAWLVGYAMALAVDERLGETRAALAIDPPRPEDLVEHVFPFLSTAVCAVVAFHLDDVDLASRTAAALQPYRRCWAHHYAGALGPVTHWLALCAAVTGDLDEAVALCRETEETLVRSGCHGLLPQLRTYFAAIAQRQASARGMP